MAFVYASVLSGLLPLAPRLFLSKSQHRGINAVLLLAALSLFTDILLLILLRFSINSWPIANLFLLLQFILLFQALGGHEEFVAFRILFWGCISFGVINFFFLQAPQTLNTYSVYAFSITLIALGINFVYKMITEMPTEKLQSLPQFWIAFGVLVYYGGTLFVFLFNNYLITHALQLHKNTWMLHNILNISKNIFFFTAVWTNYNSKTSPP